MNNQSSNKLLVFAFWVGIVNTLNSGILNEDQAKILAVISKFYDPKVDTEDSKVFMLAHFPQAENRGLSDQDFELTRALNQDRGKDIKTRSADIANAIYHQLTSLSDKDIINIQVDLVSLKQADDAGMMMPLEQPQFNKTAWKHYVAYKYIDLKLEALDRGVHATKTFGTESTDFLHEIIYSGSMLLPGIFEMTAWYCIPYALLIKFGLKITIRQVNPLKAHVTFFLRILIKTQITGKTLELIFCHSDTY